MEYLIKFVCFYVWADEKAEEEEKKTKEITGKSKRSCNTHKHRISQFFPVTLVMLFSGLSCHVLLRDSHIIQYIKIYVFIYS